jgi:phosphinothricin acetyltransferase
LEVERLRYSLSAVFSQPSKIMLWPLANRQAAFDNQPFRLLTISRGHSRPQPHAMPVEMRIATPADAAGILSIYGPYCNSTPVSFEVVAPSEAEMRARIERILDKYPWLIAEIDGKVAGYVYASQHRERAGYRWAVDVAVYVAREHHRGGIGRALYDALFAILRQQGFYSAIAGITLPNAGSVGLHESLGFRKVGVFSNVGYKLGEWLDVGWWQLELQPDVDYPPEPVDFRSIRDGEPVKSALAAAATLANGRRRNKVE